MNARAIVLILGAALLAGLGGFFVSGWLYSRPSGDALGVGAQRIDFELPDLEGRALRLSEHDGKVVLLNFWASWCGPCVEEIPMLAQFQTDHGAKGLQIVGVALDSREAVERFTRSNPINYPNMLGEMATLNIGRLYGNQRGVLPYSVLIDRKGSIVKIYLGQLKLSTLERDALVLL